MSWKMIKENGKVIWECSRYSDLQYVDINNLAEYGQPSTPYEQGFVHFDKYIPDFQNITVRMPQKEVMYYGYGRLITPKHFSIINRFLSGTFDLPNGSYKFDYFVEKNFTKRNSRIIFTNLYGTGKYPVASGVGVHAVDAAYIHGSVGFALMKGTMFNVFDNSYHVLAEIGALDDNWNFQSGNGVIQKLNPLVESLFGPNYNNLEPNSSQKRKKQEGDISIEFRGEGKRMSVGGLKLPDYIRKISSFA